MSRNGGRLGLTEDAPACLNPGVTKATPACVNAGEGPLDATAFLTPEEGRMIPRPVSNRGGGDGGCPGMSGTGGRRMSRHV